MSQSTVGFKEDGCVLPGLGAHSCNPSTRMREVKDQGCPHLCIKLEAGQVCLSQKIIVINPTHL